MPPVLRSFPDEGAAEPVLVSEAGVVELPWVCCVEDAVLDDVVVEDADACRYVLGFTRDKSLDRLTAMNLIPHASMPSFVEGVRVTGSSVGAASPMSVITPVQTAPSVAVAWHPYSLS